mmetsp:Transcript_25698/g.59163  ORF Transcript_25698/g.59163 Transcript_25698/m.59163 type:complete len:370 (-) Transcript_25698:1086-2195(-)
MIVREGVDGELAAVAGLEHPVVAVGARERAGRQPPLVEQLERVVPLDVRAAPAARAPVSRDRGASGAPVVLAERAPVVLAEALRRGGPPSGRRSAPVGSVRPSVHQPQLLLGIVPVEDGRVGERLCRVDQEVLLALEAKPRRLDRVVEPEHVRGAQHDAVALLERGDFRDPSSVDERDGTLDRLDGDLAVDVLDRAVQRRDRLPHQRDPVGAVVTVLLVDARAHDSRARREKVDQTLGHQRVLVEVDQLGGVLVVDVHPLAAHRDPCVLALLLGVFLQLLLPVLVHLLDHLLALEKLLAQLLHLAISIRLRVRRLLLRHLAAEALDLSAQLPDDLVVGILVDFRIGLDALRTRRVLEGREALLEVDVGW